VENIRAKAGVSFLFRPLILVLARYAPMSKRYSAREPGKRREKIVCVWFNTVVFLPLALR
jgi:hypothetical protein